jgi:hypothetical protein
MRVLASTLLTSALLTISSLASAQPSAAPVSPDPAPQNMAWNDVCHINGQLVPCGESNTYVKKVRKTNISTNPIGLLLGDYTIAVSEAISNHVAIRGELDYLSPIDSEYTATELDISAPIYLRRTYQGAFVEPGVVIRHSDDGYCSDGAYSSTSGCTDSHKTVGPEMLLGWHWTWDSGLNVAIAGGVGRNLTASSDEYSSDDKVFANGYLKVGYAF